MKFKKITAMLLVAAMGMSLMAGCGNSENVEETAGQAGNSDGGGEPEEIVVALMTMSPIDEANSEHVEKALNEQLLEKCNVQADFQWYDAPTYSTQIPLKIQGNEQLDLMMFTPVPASGYQSFMSQNQLMDITEYIDEYGQDIKEAMGDYLDATSKDGKVYGVGNLPALYSQEAIAMNKEVLDELGLVEEAESMETWEDYENLLTKVVEGTDMNGVINGDAEGTCISPQPFLNGGEKLSDAQWVDTLGDTYQYVYADTATDEVKCYFESDGWYDSVKRAKEMYDKGLIYKDASTSQDFGPTLIKNEVGFSLLEGAESGALSAFESGIAHSGLLKEMTPGQVSTGAFRKFGFAVPVTSEHPEAAVKVLNLLYGDAEFLDTLTWGVEGVDYVVKDDGTLTFPDGVDASTVQYHNADFLYGNRLLCTPWEGDGADIREQQKKENDEAQISKYFGFAVDTSSLTSEITACKNVVDQYKPQLSSGIVEDVDATYNEFIDSLKAAGMDKIIQEYQKQLDAWLAEQ